MTEAQNYMMKIDSLWAEGEVLAHDMIRRGEKQEGHALLDYIKEWQDLSLQSGLLPGSDK